MDFWDQPYYRMTKNLSCFMGLWPYQSRNEIISHRGIVFFLFIIQVIPEILAVCHRYVDFDVIMDSIGTFIMDLGFLINATTYIWNFHEMRLLLEDIKDNWKIFHKDRAEVILREYAEDGRKLAMLYAFGIFCSFIVFTTEPLQWRMLNFLLGSNFSVPLFCTPMEYPLINVEKYYYLLILIQEISVAIVISMVVVPDLLFFLYSQHLCGLFSALGLSIEYLPADVPSSNEDKGFTYVRRCIQIHNRAIKFSNALEGIVLWNFFLMLGLNMVIMSLTAVQVVTNMGSLGRLLKNCVFVTSQVVHLFITCIMCQRIMDHSLDLQRKIENAQWWHSTIKTQRLIKLMIMRSQTPCQVTAGKMIVMSLETFTVIIKTSASYFTVFLAMQ